MRKRANRETSMQRYVTANSLAAILQIGRNSAMRIGKEAGARVKYGGLTRYNLQKVEDFMQQLMKEQQEEEKRA